MAALAPHVCCMDPARKLYIMKIPAEDTPRPLLLCNIFASPLLAFTLEIWAHIPAPDNKPHRWLKSEYIIRFFRFGLGVSLDCFFLKSIIHMSPFKTTSHFCSPFNSSTVVPSVSPSSIPSPFLPLAPFSFHDINLSHLSQYLSHKYVPS